MSAANHYETLLYGNGQFVKKSHITLLFEWLSGRTTRRGCDDCGQIPCIGHVAVRDDDSDEMRWTPDGEEP